MMRMRTLRELDAAGVSTWTEDEAEFHLSDTFDREFRRRPDLLEPYLPTLDAAQTVRERIDVMRRALRETIRLRYPLRNPNDGEN